MTNDVTKSNQENKKTMTEKTLTSETTTETRKLYDVALDELANMGPMDSPEYINHQNYLETLIEKMEAERVRETHEAATTILRRGR